MSRIEDLLTRLCPHGVPFRSLGELLTIKNGKDHKHLGDGNVPVYGSGGVMRHVDTAMATGPSVLIPRKGSLGNLFYVEGPFWVVDTIFRTEIDSSVLEPKFLFHKLQTMGLGEMNQAGGVPSQTQSVLNLLRIPVPPLEVQQEIVRILDQFTQLEAELEAELEARRAQQSHIHRLVVKTLESSKVPLVPLGDTGTWFGGGTPSKSVSDFWSNGTIPWISPKDMGQPVVHSTEDHITERAIAASATKLIPEGSVAIVTRSSILDHTLPIAFVPQEATLNQDVKAVRSHAGIEPEYLFHILRTMRPALLRFARREGGSVASLETKKLMSFRIPVPDLNEQKRIIDLLENFEMLVSDLTSGLPAELAARRKQYEYYRDKLLTFKELAA